jgi:hypothetical protein
MSRTARRDLTFAGLYFGFWLERCYEVFFGISSHHVSYFHVPAILPPTFKVLFWTEPFILYAISKQLKGSVWAFSVWIVGMSTYTFVHDASIHRDPSRLTYLRAIGGLLYIAWRFIDRGDSEVTDTYKPDVLFASVSAALLAFMINSLLTTFIRETKWSTGLLFAMMLLVTAYVAWLVGLFWAHKSRRKGFTILSTVTVLLGVVVSVGISQTHKPPSFADGFSLVVGILYSFARLLGNVGPRFAGERGALAASMFP